jgi:pimeloyl-ACP methyl ester carboxylesterase
MKPTLVLLPGMDGTGHLFEPFLQALGDRLRCRVIAYPPDQPWGYQALVTWVREKLPPGEPFVLLGESFSGPVALMTAMAAPRNLVALVLACSFARSPAPAWGSSVWSALPMWRMPAALSCRVLMGAHRTPRLEALFRAATRQVLAPTWRARMRSVVDVDLSMRLRDVQVPVLCLRAKEDRVVRMGSHRMLMEHLPHASGVELPGPHFLLQSQAQASADAVADFVAILTTS